MLCFLFLQLTVVVEVHDAGEDALRNSVDIVLSLLGSDVQRDLECVLDACSLSQKQIEVRHLGLEVLDVVLFSLDSDGDLVEETLHETTNDHAVVLRHFAFLVLNSRSLQTSVIA